MKTKYFDIIYAPESEKTASLIYEYADKYAKDISERLGKKEPWRMPVYISPDRESLNGYYTFFPYQRIIIYDTTPADGMLGNSYDSILNVFYHELTHAVSLFYYLPALPLSFAEGAAVLFESREDQGRLNDPLFHHHLMQNKIDGTTPSWKQAAGHRDVYPGAFWAYLYGAGFSAHIEKVYGKEFYAKLWHSHFFIFPQSKTKHIFEKKLDTLWKDFTDSIYYPEDYLIPADFSLGEKSGFSLTAQTEKGFACYDFNKKNVFFYEKSGAKRRLFSSPANITDLNFSENGKLLLVSDIITRGGKIRQRLSVFDMEKNSFLKQEALSVRYAAFSSSDSICAVKVKGQFSEIVLMDLNLNEKKTLFTAGPGLSYAHVYNVVFAGENKTAFIAANGIRRDILILDTETGSLQKLTLQESLNAIRFLKSNISSEGVTLSFSWTDKDKLYRTALFGMKTSSFKILDENISGGVFQAIILNEEMKSRRLAYIGIHGKYNKLYTLDTSLLKDSKASLLPLKLQDVKAVSTAANVENLNPKKFYYTNHLWKVFPIPVLDIPSDLKNSGRYGLGISFYATDPTEFLSLKATPVFFIKPFFAQMNLEASINKGAFNINLEFHDENKNFIFRRTGFSAGFIYSLPLDRMEHLLTGGAAISVNGFYPFTEQILKSKTLYGGTFSDTSFSDSVFGAYSFLKLRHRLGTNFFVKDKYGVYCTLKMTHGVHIQSKTNAFAVQTKADFFIPVVPMKIALSGYYGYKSIYSPSLGAFEFFNNPALISSTPYLPAMPEYQGIKKTIGAGKHNAGLGLDISLTIFSGEIQTGSGFLPIFYNRIDFNLGYYSVFNFARYKNSKNSSAYFQSIYTTAHLDISGMAKLGVKYAHPMEKELYKKLGKFSLLFDLKL